MADINFNFNVEDLDDLNKLLQNIKKATQDIKKSAGNIVEEDDVVRAKKLAAEALKVENALERQKLAQDRVQTTQKKRAESLKQEKGIIGSLEKQVKELTREWKSAGTAIDKATAKNKLDNVKKQLTEAKNTTASWGKALGSFQFKFNALGNIAANVLGKMTQGAKEFLTSAIKMSLELEGVRNAFNKINDPQLLGKLQTATRGMVNNLELMRGAVNAKNLRVPIEQLGTFFEFATNRAIETGGSVTQLTDDIVKGLGRKSVLILDNLGLSVVDINKEFDKTGDFVQAAANVIQEEMKKSGVVLDTNLVLLRQQQTEWENIKLSAGTALQDIALGAVDLVKATNSTQGLLDVIVNREYKKLLKETGGELDTLSEAERRWAQLVAEDEAKMKASQVTLKKLREELGFKKSAVEETNVADTAALELLYKQIKGIEDQIKAVEELGKAKEPGKILDVKQLQEDEDEWEAEFNAFFEKQTNTVIDGEKFKNEKLREYLEERKRQRQAELDDIKAKEDEKKQVISGVNDALKSSSTSYYAFKKSQLDAYYDAEIEKAGGNEAKIEAIQKERAEKEREMAIKKALVDGALAIVKTFTSYGGFTPAALIAAGAQASATGLQIAAMKAPQFEHGGEVDGRLHSQGGTLVEAEKGEYIINRKSASKHRMLLEGINENDQLKILSALDRDKMLPTVRQDPYTKKLYDLIKNQPIYGESPEYYIKHKGNMTTKIKRNV